MKLSRNKESPSVGLVFVQERIMDVRKPEGSNVHCLLLFECRKEVVCETRPFPVSL